MHARKRTIRVPLLSLLRPGLVALTLLLAAPVAARAQWQLLDPPTTADLRGIDNVGGGVAWASGTNGTVVRTEDGGYMWQHCSTPPGGEKLDFRGIQAFDENTAIVMSSGPGDQSRLYKTTDGCQTWTLLFTNPDKAGFFDSLLLNRFDKDGMILGDPVNGRFEVWETDDKGLTWQRSTAAGLSALPNEGAFAASNSSLSVDERTSARFGTGGLQHPRVFVSDGQNKFHPSTLPMRGGSAAAGIFSMEYRDGSHWIATGGDYQKPDDANGTAAFTTDGGQHWTAAQTPPHGYRSAVAYDDGKKTWITVGPNGTDISTDDGRNWAPLTPNSSNNDAPDADRNWNALSLPFVVGPHGRIGKLRTNALDSARPAKP
jgi:photosystem II stability/assembly factor-like uncharacterized protein